MTETKTTEIRFFLEEESDSFRTVDNVTETGVTAIRLKVEALTGGPYQLAAFYRLRGTDTANGLMTTETEAHFRYRVDTAIMEVLGDMIGKPLQRKSAEAEARASR